MGVSTDGILCYGVNLGGECSGESVVDEFPWDKHDGDEEEWWRYINGFTEEWTRATSDAYFKRCKAFDAKHPFPVEIVRHGSGDYTDIIIAVKGTVTTAKRGYPEEIDRGAVASASAILAHSKFLAEHLGVTTADGPEWILCSMWW